MNIGDKIKLVRRHRGLTQQQLGILIDIKNGAANRIAQYETGYRTPKAEIVEKIAKVLNVREETFYMPNDTIVDLIRTLICTIGSIVCLFKTLEIVRNVSYYAFGSRAVILP